MKEKEKGTTAVLLVLLIIMIMIIMMMGDKNVDTIYIKPDVPPGCPPVPHIRKLSELARPPKAHHAGKLWSSRFSWCWCYCYCAVSVQMIIISIRKRSNSPPHFVCNATWFLILTIRWSWWWYSWQRWSWWSALLHYISQDLDVITDHWSPQKLK